MPMPMVYGYYRWPGIVELQGKSFFVQWFRADNFSFLFGQCFNVTFRVVTAPGYEKSSMKIPCTVCTQEDGCTLLCPLSMRPKLFVGGKCAWCHFFAGRLDSSS